MFDCNSHALIEFLKLLLYHKNTNFENDRECTVSSGLGWKSIKIVSVAKLKSGV